MTKESKWYDKDALLKFIEEHDITVTSSLEGKFTRDSIIEGPCQDNDCEEMFSKGLRPLITSENWYCKKCGPKYTKKTNKTYTKETLSRLCEEKSVILTPQTLALKFINKETVIEGYCMIEDCKKTFSKSFATLYRSGTFLCRGHLNIQTINKKIENLNKDSTPNEESKVEIIEDKEIPEWKENLDKKLEKGIKNINKKRKEKKDKKREKLDKDIADTTLDLEKLKINLTRKIEKDIVKNSGTTEEVVNNWCQKYFDMYESLQIMKDKLKCLD